MGLWEFDANQAKLTPPSKDVNTNLTDLEDDKVEDEEVEEVEDEEEEEEEAEEGAETEAPITKTVPRGEARPASGAEGQLDDATKQAVKEEFISRLGGKTILTIKGKQVDAATLSPDEIVNFLQKGIRGDQLFAENASARRQIEEERAQLEQNALRVQEILQQGTQKGRAVLPAHLQPLPDDSPEALAWKRDQVILLDKVAAMEERVQNESNSRRTQATINEVLDLAKEYPMASIDECLAVKSVRPGVNSEELARASHNYYSGEPFIRKALGANPEFKRKYDSEVIKNYLSGKSTTKRMPGTKRGSSNIDRVTSPDKKLRVKDFDDADKFSRQFFKEIKRMERQEE